MKKKLSFIIILFVCFLVTITSVFGSDLIIERGDESPAYVPGELLVKYKPDTREVTARFYRINLGIRTIKVFKSTGVHHVKLPEGMTVEEALEIYQDDPNVEYAEPNYYRHIETIPGDTHFNKLWGLHNTGQVVDGDTGTADADIDAPEAWNIITGRSSVVIAVIDSGVAYDHPDLSPNIWTNPGEIPNNGKDDDKNGYIDDVHGWDFVHNDNDPIDPHGHGTHCSGTIAAKGNNSTGIAGVCWTAKIMPLRGLDARGSGLTSDLMEAIEYANDNGADVINNSWGGGGSSVSVKNAICASDAVVVCAAGNSGTDNDTHPHYPSSYTCSSIIAVAATDQNDELASFSCYGENSVDVAAPGVNIYSSAPSRQTIWSDNFDDGSISDWTTGSEPGNLSNKVWGVSTILSFSGSYSLADSPSGNYANNTNTWAKLPVMNLSAHKGSKLEFKINGTSEKDSDFIWVESSTNGINWTLHYKVSGFTNGNWFGDSADLGIRDGESTVYVRFRFTSNNSVIKVGWFIDDVKVTVTSSSYSGTEYQFMQGTSMAAPHISGVAALIKAHTPSLTNTQIKAYIMNNTDFKNDLRIKMVTEGRVNVHNALPTGAPAPPGPDPPPDPDPPSTIPSPPSGLSASVKSSTQIDLSWKDNSSNESGFKIERKTGSGGTYSQISTVVANKTTYSNTKLTGSTTYYYRVRSYNSTGNSIACFPASATTPASKPTPPSSLSASATSAAQINLSWKDNSSNESGFKIERKTKLGGTYDQIATVAANKTTYSSTMLFASTTYYYRVRAYNLAGNSSYSNEVHATTLPVSGGGGGGDDGPCFVTTILE